MPPGQANPDITIAEVLTYLANNFYKHYEKAKYLVPHLTLAIARRESENPALEMSVDELEKFQQESPAYHLLSVLDKNIRSLEPWVLELVPEIRLSKAYQREYLYAYRRCMKRAINGGKLSPAYLGLSNEWLEARTLLAENLPINDLKLEILLAQGETDYYGHPLNRSSRKRTKNEFRIQLHGFNNMARFFCANGITDPRDVRAEHICPGPGSWYHDRKDGKQHDMKNYYCSKAGWEILRQIMPEWNLISWPTPNEDRHYGLHEGERPQLLEKMLDEIEAMKSLGAGTMRNIRVTTYRVLGYLEKIEGFEVQKLCRELEEPAQLGWLLFGGFPEHDGWRPPNPREETEWIFNAPPYRAEVLKRIRKANRNGTEEGDCRANPLLVMYKDWGIEREIFNGIITTLSSFRIANRRYLRGSTNQLDWSRDLTADVRSKKLDSPVKAWQKRKDALGQQENLWEHFVVALDRMEAHANALLVDMDSPADPETLQIRAKHWAIAIRDHLIICFLLAFQLRKANLRELKLGAELSHDTYTIQIPRNRAKARKLINKTFPRRGAFVDLMALLDLYVTEARPLLLPEGEDSTYLFLPFPSESVRRDRENNLMLSDMAINRVLRKACENLFPDLMPPGEKYLNPHVFRDMFSNYAYKKPGGDVIASQGLANTIETMRAHYLGLDVSRDNDVRSFIEEVDVDASSSNGVTTRKEVRKLIEKSLGPEASPKKVTELLKIFDRTR